MSKSRPACLTAGAPNAKVAELVDALDLGSSGVTCESSSLSTRTISEWKAMTIIAFVSTPSFEVKKCKLL